MLFLKEKLSLLQVWEDVDSPTSVAVLPRLANPFRIMESISRSNRLELRIHSRLTLEVVALRQAAFWLFPCLPVVFLHRNQQARLVSENMVFVYFGVDLRACQLIEDLLLFPLSP